MKPRIQLLIAIILLTASLPATAREVPPAIDPPYAPDRKLFQTDSLRLDWTDAARKRQVPVKIYFPEGVPGPFPVILFSHGLGGTRETYEYLARQWTANGYVCIHLQHIGSDDAAWRGQDAPVESMRKAISIENAVNRGLDVRYTLDQLESLNKSDDKLKGKLDVVHVGLAGHSFGAHTTMLLAGQRTSTGEVTHLADDRIKCVIAMSPNVPVIVRKPETLFADVKIPVFYMTGTRDDSPLSSTKANQRRIPYDHTKSNAYLLTFKDGDHMVFSGRLAPRPGDLEFQKLIRLSSTAFWDANLKSNAPAYKWLNDGPFKQLLGKTGTFEQK